MKGQTESYSFLIGIIITMLILLPLGIFIYNYLESKTLTEKCFEKLESPVNELQNGESKNVLCTIGGGKALVSFNPGKDSESSLYTAQFVSYYWYYPTTCEGACICLCKKEHYIEELIPFGSETCNEKGEKCFPVSWAKEIQGQVLQKPAFATGSLRPVFDDFFTYDDGPYNLIVERKGFILGVCTKPPCIREKTTKADALNVLNAFVTAYNKTKNYQNENCIGESFDFSLLPEGYAIELTGSYGQPVEIRLIDEDFAIIDMVAIQNDQLCTFEFNNAQGDFEKKSVYFFGIGEKDENGFVYKSETNFSWKAQYQLFRYNDTFTCFVQDPDHTGFEKINSFRDPCSSNTSSTEQLFDTPASA